MTATELEITREVDPPRDPAPDTIPAEYPCKVCGAESGPYSGRGRPPTKCPIHKRTTGGGTTRPRQSNDRLAEQAADALCQVHGLVATGAMVFGFTETATQLAAANDGFREQAVAALRTDPALCATILRAGTTSGRMALLVAYAMYVGSVTPVAWMEYKERRAEALQAASDDSA